MNHIPQDYFDRLYAGWLGKIIGIRHGAPIEGWDYYKIKDILGEIKGYPVDYREFAADDDSNGPLFFLRALEDVDNPLDLAPQDVAHALLNYAPYEHGFFWWGGYGISTEHTAYLNLRAGIPAPESGSVAQNGAAVAEQIGGQIFIDTWGLVSPGNPDQAARLAEAAASVMHGGNGVYGGIFVAVCISLAFVERDITVILRKALAYIPENCEYARVVRAVMAFYESHAEESWRECFDFIWENFGYDRYPGNCHIIPNAAVMILSMLYGGGDFEKTINICNMCGWDTDCNVGNVGTILGVMTGLEGLDYEKWVRPVNDLLICSSVMGSLNIMDVSYGASYIARQAYRMAGEKMPEPMNALLTRSLDGCHFEYPGATHALRVRGEEGGRHVEAYVRNTDEQARTGSRSIRLSVPNCAPAEKIYLYKRTYYFPKDFHDSRYDPCFSPLVYPGQTVHASVLIPEDGAKAQVSLYIRDAHARREYYSVSVDCTSGAWQDLKFDIPAFQGALIDEAGLCFRVLDEHGAEGLVLKAYVDDLYFDGQPDYTLEMDREHMECWTPAHTEVSQFTRLKGLMYLQDGRMHLTGADFAEAYTGRHDWRDYDASCWLSVQCGQMACVNFRVQGGGRSYAFGFAGPGRIALLKNEFGYKRLCDAPFDWKQGETYCLEISTRGNTITASCRGVTLTWQDQDHPYLEGAVGVSARQGTHLVLERLSVKGISES